jgi:hypothetical protein
MTQPNQPNNAPAEAREQAEEYNSTFASTELNLDDGTVIVVPPHPNLRMFDDDGLAALERLNLKLEGYDRHPDNPIPERKVYDKSGNLVSTLPAEVQPGPLKTNPHRKTDPTTGEVLEVLDPPYEVQVAQFALGEEDYARLRAGEVNGRRGSAADVWRIWNEQGAKLVERRKTDHKSDGSAGGVAPVATPDSE